MKKQILTSLSSLILFAAMPAFGQAYDFTFATTAETNIDFDNIGWDYKETTQSRDRYYINIINDTAANVYVRGGATSILDDNACMYLQGDTRLVIGDTDGTDISTMHFVSNGGDSFLEVTGKSSVVVNKNGVLSFDANRSLRNWSTSADLPSDFIHLLVDGGTFNGNIYTQNPGNAGFFNIVFRNGATLNRVNEANPLGLQGKTTFIFDNSTYNVWNVVAPQNNGFGNHSMNTGADNQDYRQTVTVTNGSIWNGAGVVANSEVTYYDFSTDITSSGMSGADFTLQLGRATSEDSYFIFQLLNGSKISAKNVVFGSDGGTNGQQMMGSLTFEMQGTEGNTSMFAAFGGTNMRLSRASESAWTNNFLMKGYAKYQTAGGFNIGYNETAGSTGNLLLTGTNNVFQIGGNFNLNGGYNTAASDAVINVSNEGATNSTFSINGMNIYSGGNSQINVKFAGATNTFNTTSNINFHGSKYETEGAAKSTIEFTDGITVNVAGGLTMTNYVAGTNEFIVSGGANVTIGGVRFTPSNSSESTGVSSIIVDGASLTTQNNWDYNGGSSSLSQIILKGDGATLTSNAQMNMNYAGTGSRKLLISMEGTNGTLEAKYNFNFHGTMTDAQDDGGFFVSMTGSGNTLKTGTTGGNFNINTENATGGTYQLYSKSDSAENKNVITVNQGEINWQGYYTGSMEAASTAKTQLILAGNTVFQREGGGNTLTFKLGEFANRGFLGGDLLLEINGSGNEFYAGALYVGNGARVAGEDRVRIVGGGSIIDLNYLRLMRGAETSWDDPCGGILEYKLDDTGISALKINNGFNGQLDGLLYVDFTGMQGNYYEERFVLMTANVSNLEDYISAYWYDFLGESPMENMRIIARDLEDESYTFAVEDSESVAGYKDFVVYYTGTAVIPEPATCAAIFGALALAFAAYRRRK
ncbi:MAG: hypothetical protein IKO42_04160 [Opitutales bacterium]|nr:hypothetical protein [Opitutales bacterium]